jgi:arylsulfatase A-like enzyme
MLADEETTIAEALPAGSDSALFGKWHLGEADVAINPPAAQGFHLYQGNLNGAIPDYYGWIKEAAVDGVIVADAPQAEYATSVTTADARAWLAARPGPWLAVLAYNAPHAPYHLPPAGTHTQPADTDCADPAAYRTCYKAAIESLDHHLAELLYDDTGELRPELADTLIIFVGDNGPPRDVRPFASARQAKDTVSEGGVRVPLIIAGDPVAAVARGRVVDDPVDTSDLFATIVLAAGGDASTGTHSISLLPYLGAADGRPDVPRAWIYTERFGAAAGVDYADAALRDASFKIVTSFGQVIGFYALPSIGVLDLPAANEVLDPDQGCGCDCLADPSHQDECSTLEAALTSLR